MRITHIASEFVPVVRVGGLGDVLQGLCRALSEKNHSVTLILPYFDTCRTQTVAQLSLEKIPLLVPFGNEIHSVGVHQGKMGRVDLILLDAPQYFCRGKIYGCEDDDERFAFFSRAAVEMIRQDARAEIVHLHDWHAALCAPLLRGASRIHPPFIVLTIHNLAYQGICRKEILVKAGLADEISRTLHDPKQKNFYNLLKGGVLYSDHITTVSPRYAQEILTTREGGALRHTFTEIEYKFSGILNGIDYQFWNPQTDEYLPEHFSCHDISSASEPPFIENKEKLKNEIRKRLLLATERRPLVSAVTRLVPQKGPERIKEAAELIPKLGGQFVLLGSALDEKTEAVFIQLKNKLGKSSHVHLEIGFDEEFSHLLFAGSDLFLVPSRFEPCGLTQLIAMRYGTVPLVRATGGLADTVEEEVNGFTFGPYSQRAFQEALKKAFFIWKNQPLLWRSLMEKGMTADYSWNRPAEKYLSLYTHLTSRICHGQRESSRDE